MTSHLAVGLVEMCRNPLLEEFSRSVIKSQSGPIFPAKNAICVSASGVLCHPTNYWGFAPRPHCGTSVPQTPYNPSVYSAALRGSCCILPCVVDASIVNCAVCQQFNKRTFYTGQQNLPTPLVAP